MSKRINSKCDLQPLLEKMAAEPGIRHKLIRLYLMAQWQGLRALPLHKTPSAVAAEGVYKIGTVCYAASLVTLLRRFLARCKLSLMTGPMVWIRITMISTRPWKVS